MKGSKKSGGCTKGVASLMSLVTARQPQHPLRLAGSRSRPLTLNSFFLFALLVLAVSTRADDALISGTVGYRAFTASGKLFAQSQTEFHCRVTLPLATNWNIKIDPSSPNEGSCYEVGNAPEGVFRFKRTNLDRLSELLAKEKHRTNLVASVGNGLITPTGIPPSEPQFSAGPIWFAYASSYYFLTNGENRIRPLWPTPIKIFVSGEYQLQFTSARSQTAPDLITTAAFMSPGSYPEGGALPTVVPATIPLKKYPAPYDAGFTNGLYECIGELRQAGGSFFPSGFRLRQFRPKPEGKVPSEIVLAAEWTGAVTSLTVEKSASEYKPQLPEGSKIMNDYRFSGSELSNLQYSSSNQVWTTSAQGTERLGRIDSS